MGEDQLWFTDLLHLLIEQYLHLPLLSSLCEEGQVSLSTTLTRYCFSVVTPAGFQEISHIERIFHWIWETCSPRRSETLHFKDLQLSVYRSTLLGGTERSGVPGTATEIEVN